MSCTGVSLLQTGMIPQLSFVVAVHVEEILPAALYYDSEKPYHYIRRLDAAHPNVLIIGGADKKVLLFFFLPSPYRPPTLHPL